MTSELDRELADLLQLGDRIVRMAQERGGKDLVAECVLRSGAELSARVRSLLRRDSGASTASMQVADLELDTARHVARRGSRELDLTAKEFALLRFFMAHAGEVLSQETLLEHVWDEHADPFTNAVRITVSTLRRKLGDPPLVETVTGSGYRIAP